MRAATRSGSAGPAARRSTSSRPTATCRVVGEFQDEGSGPPITCTMAENSFALPDPLRNLPAPAKPALAPPMVFADPVGPAPTPPKNCPVASPHRAKDHRPCARSPRRWAIGRRVDPVPGPVPRRPGGLSQDRTVYLMPGIYWIGGGGLDIGGGGSIVTIATETDAKPNVALAPCASADDHRLDRCGGVLIYNSTLPASAAGGVILNSNGRSDEARGIQRSDVRSRTPSTTTSSSSRTGRSRSQ